MAGWLLQRAYSSNNPGLIFVQKAFFSGLIFGVAYFRRGLLLEEILRFKIGLVCQ